LNTLIFFIRIYSESTYSSILHTKNSNWDKTFTISKQKHFTKQIISHGTVRLNHDTENAKRRWKTEIDKDCSYFGSIEPNQIERIEIERRVRTVENRPCSKLSRSEAWDNNAGEFGIIEFGALAGISSGDGEKCEEDGEEEKRFVRHWSRDRNYGKKKKESVRLNIG